MQNFVDHNKNIVELADVSFSYGNDEVLRGISLQIHKGDYLGIVGPNGAGKTTLLKVMLGILKPSHGTIKLFGTDIKDFKDWQKIGYVPQKATNFDIRFPATVLDVVTMGRYGNIPLCCGLSVHDRALVKDALVTVDMWEHKDTLIGVPSGEQQQVVFIARALATGPEIIFLDEPTTSMAKRLREKNNLRSCGKSPGYKYPLLLSPGEVADKL